MPIYLDDAPAINAARAIVSHAERPRRQRIVGTPNWLAVQAHKFAPGLLDHLTADTGPTPTRPNRASPRCTVGAGDSAPRPVTPGPLLRSVERSLAHATHAVSSRAREIVSDWGR